MGSYLSAIFLSWTDLEGMEMQDRLR